MVDLPDPDGPTSAIRCPGPTRTETPFKIRGSRTSRTVFTTINNYVAVVPAATTSTPIVQVPVVPGGLPVPTPVPPAP